MKWNGMGREGLNLNGKENKGLDLNGKATKETGGIRTQTRESIYLSIRLFIYPGATKLLLYGIPSVSLSLFLSFSFSPILCLGAERSQTERAVTTATIYHLPT